MASADPQIGCYLAATQFRFLTHDSAQQGALSSCIVDENIFHSIHERNNWILRGMSEDADECFSIGAKDLDVWNH